MGDILKLVKKLVFALFLSAVFVVFPFQVLASIGVGVGTGKIQVTEKLYPGTIYQLPPLTVINTGDQPGDYSVGISYLENQPELKPDKSWFSFNPSEFRLDPGKSQIVDIKLNLPLGAIPGKYFAFVEGFPAKKAGSGTTVGIAAAAKLYFTIQPANVLSGIYYRGLSLWNLYSPWPERAGILIVIFVAGLLARKYLKIQVGLKKEDQAKEE